jgi:hypothetical protein
VICGVKVPKLILSTRPTRGAGAGFEVIPNSYSE